MSKFHVGQKVTTSGYPGTVYRLLDWAPGMIEVRLQSGIVCVPVEDCMLSDNERLAEVLYGGDWRNTISKA